MRVTFDVALCGSSVWLPTAVETTDAAVAQGKIDAASAARLGVSEVHVADGDVIPPDMAAAAARLALARSGVAPADLGLIIHCSVWHQGYDIWSAPHYIADQIGAVNAQPLSLSQGCNAVMPAIELTAGWLAQFPSGTALITAADRFLVPGFDRWKGAFGCVYGDAGAAAVIRRGPAAAALAVRAVRTRAVPEFEEMNRAGLVPSRAGRGCDENVDLRAPKRNFFARHGTQRFKQLTEWAIRTVIVESLAEAGIQPDDPRIRAVAVPRMNDSTTTMYRRLLGELVPAPVVPLQAATGHLSCADVLANAADLQSELLAAPGHIAIILNVGGGYTWSSLIVEASPG